MLSSSSAERDSGRKVREGIDGSRSPRARRVRHGDAVLVDGDALLREEEEHCEDTAGVQRLGEIVVVIDELLEASEKFGIVRIVLRRVDERRVQQLLELLVGAVLLVVA